MKIFPVMTRKRRGGAAFRLVEVNRDRKVLQPDSDLPKGDISRVPVEVWDIMDSTVQGPIWTKNYICSGVLCCDGRGEV